MTTIFDFTCTLTDALDNDLSLFVVFSYTPGDPGHYLGPPEDCYPAIATEIEIESITIPLPIPTIALGPDRTPSLVLDSPPEEFELSDFLSSATIAIIEAACFDEYERLKEEAETDPSL